MSRCLLAVTLRLYKVLCEGVMYGIIGNLLDNFHLSEVA